MLQLSMFLVATCTWNAVGLAQKTLSWRFADEFRWEIVMKQETTITQKGRENKISQVLYLDCVVRGLNLDQSANVEQEIKRITINNTVGGLSLDTGSDEKIEGIAAEVMKRIKPLIGMKVIAVTTPLGRVKDVIVPPETVESLKALQMEERMLKEMTVQGALIFPDRAISVGDTWTSDITVEPSDQPVPRLHTTYQYLGEEVRNGRKLEKIKSTTAIKVTGTGDGTIPQITKQESNGTLWFDNTEGYVVLSEMKQETDFRNADAPDSEAQKVTQSVQVEFIPRPATKTDKK